MAQTPTWSEGRNNLSSRVTRSSGRAAWAPATCGGPPSPPESAGLVTACSSGCVSIPGAKSHHAGLATSATEGAAFPATKLTPGTGRRVFARGHTPSASWPRPLVAMVAAVPSFIPALLIKVVVQPSSRVRLFATPWTAAPWT